MKMEERMRKRCGAREETARGNKVKIKGIAIRRED